MELNKAHIWAEMHQLPTVKDGNTLDSYLLDLDIPLKTFGWNADLEEGLIELGKANVHIVDESWLKGLRTLPLKQQLHYDFNDEMNWNAITSFEYLEDALDSIQYGEANGFQGTLAVLHKIHILPSYRGHSLFAHYMESIIELLRKMKVDYIALQPHPFGEEEMDVIELEVGKLKLQRFYSQYGFKEYPIEKGVPYMVLPVKQYEQSSQLSIAE